ELEKTDAIAALANTQTQLPSVKEIGQKQTKNEPEELGTSHNTCGNALTEDRTSKPYSTVWCRWVHSCFPYLSVDNPCGSLLFIDDDALHVIPYLKRTSPAIWLQQLAVCRRRFCCCCCCC
ncbi:hypothetical protein DQ04_25731000, partial [Trypanosoma grayi]|uniref:hypothetical protein n=1 Tax=Trypanosoma grayi TaxID=71804 RepID=UPI0004F497B9